MGHLIKPNHRRRSQRQATMEDYDPALKNMVAFMVQEATEKATEINVKAEEDFNIEKNRLVQSEKIKIIERYDKKMKQIDTDRKIAMSHELNKQRLTVLSAQDSALERVLEASREKLAQASKDTGLYTTLLENLVLEGLYALVNEADVNVQCREQDTSIVKSVSEKAAARFTEETGREVKLTIATEYLPAAASGGLKVTAQNGKIAVDNTLEARMDIAFEKMLPLCRKLLFASAPKASERVNQSAGVVETGN